MIAILPFLLFATIGDQEPATPDLRTMQMAQYLAGSAAADLEAAGGFGTSENVPVVLPRGELPDIGVRALLKKTKTGLSFTLANGGNTAAWFYAGDSRILAWLEAKDANGDWKPIEWDDEPAVLLKWKRLSVETDQEFLIYKSDQEPAVAETLPGRFDVCFYEGAKCHVIIAWRVPLERGVEAEFDLDKIQKACLGTLRGAD